MSVLSGVLKGYSLTDEQISSVIKDYIETKTGEIVDDVDLEYTRKGISEHDGSPVYDHVFATIQCSHDVDHSDLLRRVPKFYKVGDIEIRELIREYIKENGDDAVEKIVFYQTQAGRPAAKITLK